MKGTIDIRACALTRSPGTPGERWGEGRLGAAKSSLFAEDYRRRARRLRHLFADRPTELHRRLRELSANCDRATKQSGAGYEPDSKARLFAHFVAGAMGEAGNPVLRYSKRQELIRVANQFGIKRFEANLIIAAVEHNAPVPRASRPCERETRARRPWYDWVVVSMLIVGIQSLIGLGVWWMFHA